jgi:DNA uptake protein ComE-like DNA-binding protein
LNSLKGAGSLGRAIVRGRPYRSADDLVKKQVVRRTVYERIKDQVTVQ